MEQTQGETTSPSSSEGDNDILLEKNVFLYNIPLVSISMNDDAEAIPGKDLILERRCKASHWDTAHPLRMCRLVVTGAGRNCNIQLENILELQENLTEHFDPQQVFARAIIEGVEGSALQPTLDSSRYFTIKYQNLRGDYERMGLGFLNRTDSSDLTETLEQYFASERTRETEFNASGSMLMRHAKEQEKQKENLNPEPKRDVESGDSDYNPGTKCWKNDPNSMYYQTQQLPDQERLFFEF